MPITPEQRARLDRLMNDRRLELGITWREVALRAGRSYEALRQLRAGPGGINELTAVQFARALDWTPRSILDVLADGDPQIDADVTADDRPEVVRGNWSNENVRKLWSLTISEAQRVALIEDVLATEAAEQETNGSTV